MSTIIPDWLMKNEKDLESNNPNKAKEYKKINLMITIATLDKFSRILYELVNKFQHTVYLIGKHHLNPRPCGDRNAI